MAESRSCKVGDVLCTLCCDTHGVPAIGKPNHHLCELCVPEKGCRKYSERPSGCAGLECAFKQDLRPEDTWPHTAGFVQERIFNELLGWVWTICEGRNGALQSSLARREIAWALAERKIVALETTAGKMMFIIPIGRRISSTAQLVLATNGAQLVFEEDLFRESV